jgi:hydrogenase maturation protease
VGRRAAEAVADCALPGVEALSIHQLTPELAERIAAARLVLFIDASVEDIHGEVAARRLWPKEDTGSSAHTGDARGLLALAESLYGRCPPAWLVTVPAAKLNLGEGLSPVAERGLQTVLQLVREMLTPCMK